MIASRTLLTDPSHRSSTELVQYGLLGTRSCCLGALRKESNLSVELLKLHQSLSMALALKCPSWGFKSLRVAALRVEEQWTYQSPATGALKVPP